MALVLLRDRDDETQVRVDHPVLGLDIATLDHLRELDLLGGAQQRVLPRLVQEELERVGRRGRQVAVDIRRGADGLAAAIVGEGDSPLLDLGVERFEVLLVELQILNGGAELRQIEATGFLAGVEDGCEALPTHRVRCSRRAPRLIRVSEMDTWRWGGPDAIVTKMTLDGCTPVRGLSIASKGSSNRRLRDAQVRFALGRDRVDRDRALARSGFGRHRPRHPHSPPRPRRGKLRRSGDCSSSRAA